MRFLYTALSLLSFAVLAYAFAPPRPSPVYVARSSYPSPGVGYKRSPRERRGQVSLGPGEDPSRHLCPSGMSVCPIGAGPSHGSMPTSLLKWIEEGFECVDMNRDLNSCGGCGIVNAMYDCTAIPNSFGVACVEGGCHVQSCKWGFVPSDDNKGCTPVH